MLTQTDAQKRGAKQSAATLNVKCSHTKAAFNAAFDIDAL